MQALQHLLKTFSLYLFARLSLAVVLGLSTMLMLSPIRADNTPREKLYSELLARTRNRYEADRWFRQVPKGKEKHFLELLPRFRSYSEVLRWVNLVPAEKTNLFLGLIPYCATYTQALEWTNKVPAKNTFQYLSLLESTRNFYAAFGRLNPSKPDNEFCSALFIK